MYRSMFEDDPFFRDSMMDMHRMMGMPSMQPPINHPYTSVGRRHTEPSMAMSPFGMTGMGMGMGGIFGGMQSMMSNMENPMRMMQANQGMPGSSFQSSYTSISYGNGGGQPSVYQASSSTRVGPNGVKETQKTERNSSTGLQKMSIGHHIGERSHTIEKSRNSRTGDNEESQEFINLEEDEADEFDNEWKQRTRSAPAQHRSVAYHPVERHSPYPHHRHEPAAIEYHQPSGSRPHRQHRRRDNY